MTSKEIDLHRLMGEPRSCLVRDTGGGKGPFEILSPGVGLYDRPPAVGTCVRPGSFAGYLTVLRRYYHLLIPEGHYGIVTDLHVTARKQHVGYGEPLFRVDPETSPVSGEEVDRGEEEAETPEEGVPEGTFGVRSPTDGIFYRRADPRSPAYVEEGSVVSAGTVLALVEVMKCFNPIVYPGGPEFPPTARIQRVIPRDASEVKHGQVLFVVEPA